MLSTSDLARSFLTQERRLSGRNSSVGLECRVPSRTKEKYVCEAVVQPAGGLGVTSTLQDKGELLAARQWCSLRWDWRDEYPPGHRRSLVCEAAHAPTHNQALYFALFCSILLYSYSECLTQGRRASLRGVSHAGEQGTGSLSTLPRNRNCGYVQKGARVA